MMYSKFLIKLVFVIFSLLSWPFPVSAGESQFSGAKSFLWEVKSETATAYILGSIHFANESIYPLNKNVENAFRDSSVLAVEFNPLLIDEKEMAKIVLDKGVYKGNETIEGNISDETFNLLQTFITNKNIPAQNIIKMKPPLLAITLSSLQLVQMGFMPEYGIDLYFCKKAKSEKSIVELESMEEQLTMIFDMPNEDLFLKYTLLDLFKMEKILNDVIESWSIGDSNSMDNFILKPYEKYPELEPILDEMFYKRNVKMARKIKQMLAKKQKVFVVVGAGHLVGDKGIIQLLRNNKYSVHQL